MKILVLLLSVTIATAQNRDVFEHVPARELDRKNPVEGDEKARRVGEKLYLSNCASCHGSLGKGSRTAPPLDRNDVQQASAGALFWLLRNGSLRHGMPSFAHLPEVRRWQIVTYLQSLGSKRVATTTPGSNYVLVR